jgi:serine phosphatase RsbU (regulator of sigma subunit)
MVIQTENIESNQWTEVLYHPGKILIQEITLNWPAYKMIFIDQIAENLYNNIRRTQHLFTLPFALKKEYSGLSEDEKSFWQDFACKIPGKLKSLNLRIRQYKDFCRTCLIPFNDLEKLAMIDYGYQNLPEERKRFYLEMNHLIPVVLKKAGYEIIRPVEVGEINDRMVTKLARAIHSRYQHEMKKQIQGSDKKISISWIYNQGDAKNAQIGDFNDLTEEIRHSNLDNAFHIPTKLLAIGYKIRPVGKGFKPAAVSLAEEEVEIMAKIEHLRWCWDKTLHGWFYGKVKDSRKKIHPSIIPYEDLSETEKQKDRELVKLIPSLLKDIGYEVFPVSPDRISKLPYAIKPHSGLRKILDETRQMNTQIRNLVTISPEIDEMVQARNLKVEEAIREVESSYNYAQHIQETFLPDNLYVRECFPDNFILFMPKDVVSGDFYFFSRQGNLIIFAAADCTGHGIPGALISTIGYGILDQAVNEIRLTDPIQILHHLYSKTHRFLRLDSDGSGMSDDMDIILCILDVRTNIMIYSGVKNSLYHIRSGELFEYRAANLPVDFSVKDNTMFSSVKIKIEPGDTIYLCSDGYTDQFGGKCHKKYQSTRFKCFLQSIQGFTMAEQNDLLYEEIEKWREENNEDQTDDILVIGIRI